MAWTAEHSWSVGEVVTAANMNASLRDNMNAAFPVGKLEFFIHASAGAGVENLINGAWLECNGASVLRATYSALDTMLAALTPARPFGTVDGTHVTLPDLRGGRYPAHIGGHTDVATLGNSDGVTDANRRPKHRHTPHSHGPSSGSNFQTLAGSGGTLSPGASGGGTFSSNGATTSTTTVDGGSGNSNDTIDSGPYQVAGIWTVKALP